MSLSETRRVALSSIEIEPGGESFVLGLVGEHQEVLRMQMPSWTAHQLMRILPRLDAALLHARDNITSDLVAHELVEWSMEKTGVDRTVAVCVKTDQLVESAFLLSHDDAMALHAALGESLEMPREFRASGSAGSGAQAPLQRAIRPTSRVRSAWQALKYRTKVQSSHPVRVRNQ